MSQPFRRSISVMALGCLLVLLFLLAACGSDTTSSSATSDTHSGKQSVMTVTVKESKGADGKDVYTFDPTSITVKKGIQSPSKIKATNCKTWTRETPKKPVLMSRFP